MLHGGGSSSKVFNVGGAGELIIQDVDARLPAGLIDEGETVILMLRPSVLYIPLVSASSLMLIAILTLGMAWLATRAPWAWWTDVQAFGIGVGIGFLRLGWQTLEWVSRIYVLTDRRVVRRMGVISPTVFETPLSNIHHASVFSLVRERLFGLGSVGFATKDSDTFQAFWVMIRQPLAVHRIVMDAVERFGQP